MNELVDRLYADQPSETMYHYTSIEAVPNIVQTGGLWATDIHYFNDAAELSHTAALLVSEIESRQQVGAMDRPVLDQFLGWIRHRVANGHTVFVSSFTPNGNLLSQWRSYCPYGRGVSLAFRRVICSAPRPSRVSRLVGVCTTNESSIESPMPSWTR